MEWGRCKSQSKLFFKDGDLIEKGKKVAEWDPYTLPVIAETGGIVNYMDLLEGSSLTETLDDATGEAFDKCGKRMGLPYPSGPQIDKLSKEGDPHKFIFPISKLSNYNVSYSGVKTAFINFISNNEQKNPDFIINNLVDLCASLQYTLVQIILNKIELVARDKNLTEIVIGGGVAANTEIRKQLQDMVIKEDWKLSLPPLEYTTDNAAMIGITAYYKILKKEYGSFKDSSNARLKFN